MRGCDGHGSWANERRSRQRLPRDRVHEGCPSPTNIGSAYSCAYSILNVADTAHDSLQITGLFDTVLAKSGAVDSGNILGSLELVFSGAGVTCTGGSGGGTSASPYVGATSCTLPFGTSIQTNPHSFYTVVAGDFTLPNHQLNDMATLAWKDLCTGTSTNCAGGAQNATAGSSSSVLQIVSSTATAIHDSSHATVTTVGVGTTVHDFVTVTGQAGSPAPGGNVSIDWFLNGDCSGSPNVNSGPVGPVVPAGGFTSTFDATAFSFTVNSAGARAFRAHYLGDPTYAPSDGPCEPLTVVDANIQITPANATNVVNTNHALTGHVNVNAGNGFVNAPDGTTINFSIVSGPGSFVGASSCQTAGGTGSCTVQITSAMGGTTVVHATTDVTVAGVVLHRGTDGTGLNSGNANKLWLAPDANIQIAPPTATNAVGTNHALTGHVNVAPGGVTFVNAPDGTTINFSIVSGPGSFVGPNSCQTAGGTGSCTVQITSTAVGTTVVHATTDVTVSGVVLHRETDGAGLNSGNASKNWVDANIQITPANATNAVGTNHVLTITVNALGGTIDAGPHTATASIVSGPGSFVGSPTCTYTGGAATASCTVTITSASVGTTVVSATSDIPVGGVTITRTTNTAANTAAGGSGNATKLWADDVVSTHVRDAANADVTNTTVSGGTVVHDEATVAKTANTPASVPAPTGTVSFTLYNNGTCNGTVVATDPNKPLSSGTANSATFTAPNTNGTFSYLAHSTGMRTTRSTTARASRSPFGKLRRVRSRRRRSRARRSTTAPRQRSGRSTTPCRTRARSPRTSTRACSSSSRRSRRRRRTRPSR